MSWQAVPVAIIAGITGYAAVIFIGLYAALAKLVEARARREYLTFALTCVSVVAYDLFSVNLYNSLSLEQGIFWQRLQFVTAGVLGGLYISFVWDFIKKPTPTLIRATGIVLAVLGILVGVIESPVTLTVERPLRKHVHVLNHEIIYYEAESGIIPDILMGLFFLVFAINIFFLVRHLQSPNGRQIKGRYGFLLAMVISAITATNDVLVAMGVSSFLYLFEYGIAALFLAMGYILLMRFGDLHQAINALNTDLSKSNAELQLALEKARESDRAKTEFLASISHELRTPLNAIINIPEGLLTRFKSVHLVVCGSCKAEFELEDDELFDKSLACEVCGETNLQENRRLLFRDKPDKTQGALQTVVRAGQHLLGLVNSVLYASRLELGHADLSTSSFDPVELVKEVVESTQPLADKKDIKIVSEECASLGLIVADRVKICQVLYNVMDNAIKFSPQSSVVKVNASVSRQDRIVIGVRDQGIGISKDQQAVIFEKFHQLDSSSTRAYSGAGLGLAISKGLVELHGGRIWVESAADCGAAFFIELPKAPFRRDKTPASLSASAVLSDNQTVV